VKRWLLHVAVEAIPELEVAQSFDRPRGLPNALSTSERAC
jgi:hypothetical protein